MTAFESQMMVISVPMCMLGFIYGTIITFFNTCCIILSFLSYLDKSVTLFNVKDFFLQLNLSAEEVQPVGTVCLVTLP
jgi:hypothetical protein